MHKPSNTLQQVKEWLEKCSRFPFETMKKWDALYYIQQLETRLTKVERERNAAVNDLSKVRDCALCKKFDPRKHCSLIIPCVYGGKKHFEWRGVCSENTKGDANA